MADSCERSAKFLHPTHGMGPHARRMFEEAVEQGSIIRVPTRTSEALVNAGLLYDRPAGYDSSLRETYSFTPRIDAWDDYCAWLDQEETERNES